MRRVLFLVEPVACYRDLCRASMRCLSPTTWSSLERCIESDLIGREARKGKSMFEDQDREQVPLSGVQSQ